MGLKQPYMIKTVMGDTDLSLKAEADESFLIKDIFIIDPAADYISVKIDRTLVGYLRCGGVLGSHVNLHRGSVLHSHSVDLAAGASITDTNHQQIKDAGGGNTGLYLANSGTTDGDGTRVLDLSRSGEQDHGTLIDLLTKKGIFKGFPVATGQTFTVTGAKQANAIQMVIYEIYDPGDIKAEVENGTLAGEYVFVNYGNCGASIKTAADHLLNTSKNPAEFPDFPFGNVVPANYEMDILGILGSPFAPKENNGTNYSYTKYLKLVKDRTTLFDEDRNGLLFLQRTATAKGTMDTIAEGWTMIGNYSDVDGKEPMIFPEPLKFVAGDELNTYITLDAGGTKKDLAIDEHEIGLITRVRRAK